MIKSCATTAGKLALLKGQVTPDARFKLALYTSAADLGPNTEKYTSVGEVVGQNYKPLDLPSPSYKVVGREVYLGFKGEAKWQNSTIEADGALFYVESLDNLALFVVAFPDTVRSTNHEFVVSLIEEFFKI
jgi:hypothetical protein